MALTLESTVAWEEVEKVEEAWLSNRRREVVASEIEGKSDELKVCPSGTGFPVTTTLFPS
jgi:hypothetical protein